MGAESAPPVPEDQKTPAGLNKVNMARIDIHLNILFQGTECHKSLKFKFVDHVAVLTLFLQEEHFMVSSLTDQLKPFIFLLQKKHFL